MYVSAYAYTSETDNNNGKKIIWKPIVKIYEWNTRNCAEIADM